ncbi:MAG: hypothetical protein KAY32_17515 [Candidatus Eisenbacteria sp.]|nr:hypothetical protein [Candidatus Eisenbacteria bacterium]
MNDNELTSRSLDDLARLARAGEREAERVFFDDLRVRFLEIAKRRVREEDREDLVQDALGIVLAKYRRTESPSLLPWGLTILRNVIGNYYQRRATREREQSLEERTEKGREAQVPALEILEQRAAQERVERVLAAMESLARRHPRCGQLFRRLLESLQLGGGAREISRRAMAWLRGDLDGATENSLYVALHRCRQQLRRALHDLEGARP